jgi:hypothetical protein
VGVVFFDTPGRGTNSDHSLFAGLGRGNGDEWRPARSWLAPLPATWFNHVVKSCAIADRGDGASVGAPLVAACAWADAKTDSKKNREKLTVPNTLAFIIFAPRSVQPNGALRSYSELGRCLGTHQAKLRYVYLRKTRPAICGETV